MDKIIEVKGLTKSFKQLEAVKGISFSVQRGQCFGLLGPNGAGKSTTIEMLEGITTKDAGEIEFNGRPMTRQDLAKVGIQFQHTAIQDYLTSVETINLFRALYENPLGKEALIELCQLQDFADQDHRKLSGGQKQRLLLALALVNDPDILFLDEPTTGLDPQARRNFWLLINKIKGQGKTILLTTHYMDEAEFLCDYIAIMDKGQIITEGEPKRLLSQHFPGAIIRLKSQPLPPEFNAEVVQEGKGLQLTTTDLQTTLSSLVEQGVALDEMQVKTANLDDLFLKLTGHSLQAEKGAA